MYYNPNLIEHHNSHPFPLPDFQVQAKGMITRNPESIVPLVKTATTTIVTALLTPFNSLLVNHTFKNLSIAESAKVVRKNPFAGVKPVIIGIGIDSAIVFSIKDIAECQLKRRTSLNKDQASTAGYFTGSMVASVVTNPLEYTRIQMIHDVQEKKSTTMSEVFRRSTTRDLFRGLVPAILRGGMLWGFGLGVGQRIYHQVQEVAGDSTVGFLASKSVGWSLGNFIASPFYNMQGRLKSDLSLLTMRDVLKEAKIVYDPKKYKPRNYKVTSTAKRTLLLMPTDPTYKPTIEKSETMRLRIYHIIENTPNLWRGFTKALPLIIIGGSVVGLAERLAKKFANSCSKSEKINSV